MSVATAKKTTRVSEQVCYQLPPELIDEVKIQCIRKRLRSPSHMAERLLRYALERVAEESSKVTAQS